MRNEHNPPKGGLSIGVEPTMMSAMEKNAQIGELVTQRQEQKVAVEHLKLKGKKVAAAYSAFAHSQERWRVDDTTGTGHVYLLHPQSNEREHPKYLLAQAELAQYIREVAKAEQALAATNAQLTALGVTL